MATTAATLVQRTRRFMGDWPENDSLTASMSAATTTLTVADSSLYAQGFILQVEQEALYVSATPSATTVTVRRAQRGTSAVTHATASAVLVRPHFLDVDYLDALNSAIDSCYPMLYQPTADETTVTAVGTYEYAIPNLNPSEPIRAISKLEFKETSDLAFRELNGWDVNRGSSPKIRFKRDLPGGTLRIIGFSPLPPLADLNDSLSVLFPKHAEDILPLYAAQYLLASGEARRVREDTGARDDREAANRMGGSMNASQGLLQRFQLRLSQAAMPPMPKHVKSVI